MLLCAHAVEKKGFISLKRLKLKTPSKHRAPDSSVTDSLTDGRRRQWRLESNSSSIQQSTKNIHSNTTTLQSESCSNPNPVQAIQKKEKELVTYRDIDSSQLIVINRDHD